jgi:hypothetical protein
MRNTTLQYIFRLWKVGFSAIAFLSISAIANEQTAQAQNNVPKIPNSTFNGLFSPNAAQRFFEEGREDFEREIKFVTNSEGYFNGDLLEINEELLEQIKENQSFQEFDFDTFKKK